MAKEDHIIMIETVKVVKENRMEIENHLTAIDAVMMAKEDHITTEKAALDLAEIVIMMLEEMQVAPVIFTIRRKKNGNKKMKLQEKNTAKEVAIKADQKIK